MEDLELNAMSSVLNSLQALDPIAQKRVLLWAISRLELDIKSENKKDSITDQPSNTPLKNEHQIESFTDIGDLFSVINAAELSTSDRVLLVASFLQLKQKKEDLNSREINSELTQLGYGLANITKGIDPLIEKKPQLIIQTKKDGKTQQAQKKYRVTKEGLKAAELLLK